MLDQADLSTHPVPDVRIDGVWLPFVRDSAVDVLIDGRRVWSFNPVRDAQRVDGLWHVGWPHSLRPYLSGVAQFTVREHNGGYLLVDSLVQFGDRSDRIEVQDRVGNPLAVDKMGRLLPDFSQPDPERRRTLLRAVQDVIALLNDKAEVPAFLAFGALLGAVRDGHLISHDVDVDIAYPSAFSHPADVARESYRLERLFIASGWKTWRFSAADFKVQADGLDGDVRWIDVFAAFTSGDVFYVMPEVSAPAGSVPILPLGTITLDGHIFPAPNDPQSLLHATYGPGWSTPDPAFKYRAEPATQRRLDGWMRNTIDNRGHWFPFYEGQRAGTVPDRPSAFATWFAEQESPSAKLVDLGCGTGRDTLWLSEQGFVARGVDYAPPAVERAREAAQLRGCDARFDVLNLYDTRQVLALGGLISHDDQPVHLYARFFLHALTIEGRENLWLLARMSLRRRGRLYLEFRVEEPEGNRFEFGSHFREHLSSEFVAAEISRYGGDIEYLEEGYGMAVYKNEDPLVARVVASWQR